jgi:outer membrane immunogenic protein
VQLAGQYQWGSLVAGAEASYTWIDFDDTTAGHVTPGLTFSSNVSNLLIVAAKLGYAQDRALFFTKVGYASADVTIRSTSGAVTNTSSAREDGWMMGIGLDYAITDRVIVGVEYDRAMLSPDTRTLGALTANPQTNDVQTLMARLMLKFGRN